MSAIERRFTFIVDDLVERDINDVYDHDSDQGDLIVALLEEMEGDHRLCERLIDVGLEDDQVRSVKEFSALQRVGYNTYTVRCWNIDDWRVITGVDHRSREIAVLYIMKRTEDYDQVAQQRVIEAYERLDFKRLGGRR